MNWRLLITECASLSILLGLGTMYFTNPGQDVYKVFASEKANEYTKDSVSSFCSVLSTVPQLPEELRNQINSQITINLKTGKLVQRGIHEIRPLATSLINTTLSRSLNGVISPQMQRVKLIRGVMNSLNNGFPTQENPVATVVFDILESQASSRIPDKVFSLGEYAEIVKVDKCDEFLGAFIQWSGAYNRQLVSENTQSENYYFFTVYQTNFSSSFLPDTQIKVIGILNHFYVYGVEKTV